ncbi:MAG: hypothetical protein HYY50_01765 [Candidatus Kerfeldbacteria bacterium]|nr:hypothetical protein [Candidatus Kerfeldbacteria bacterium]
MLIHTLKGVARRLVLCSAGLWLITQAWLTLDLTFDIPFGYRDLLALVENERPWGQLLSEWLLRTWPGLGLIVILFLRQEAHRWFKIRRGRKSADRLVVSWLTFLGTLMVVDWLSPHVRLQLPASAIEATIWLVQLAAMSWMSRLSHPATRRKWHIRFRRWHVPELLQATLSQLIILKPWKLVKGFRRHASHHSHRAR